MAMISVDIQELYGRTFGSKPMLPQGGAIGEAEADVLPVLAKGTANNRFTPKGRVLYEQYQGREVWLPVRLYAAFGANADVLELPYSVVRATCKKHIVSASLTERQGTVKELYSVDDWQITIKGFLINKNRNWPEDDIEKMNRFFRLQQALVIQNVLTDVLLENQQRPEEQCRVVMESLDFAEMEGGRTRIQAFSMRLLSDSVFTLEWKG